ncbi:MAG: ABC transporter permease [Spirochaetes bacterium]|nr:MAG: ABC transporter permease [Spirochaetota bacterium]
MLGRMWTIFVARNKEFYRDRSAFGWNILFPFLVIIGFSFLFNQDRQAMFKVGVITTPGAIVSPVQAARFEEFRKTHFLEFVELASADEAISKLQHHRIDMLVDPTAGEYWVSRSSPKGYITEKLLGTGAAADTANFKKREVEGFDIPYVEWMFPGILGMNMMFSALFGVGYVVVRYRKNGALKRLSVAPLSPFEFLTAQIISRMVILIVTTAIVYAGCALMYGFQCRGSYASLAFVFALGGFSMISLGLLIAARSASEEFAGGVLNVLSWPMMFLSEVWFSLEGAKPWVKGLAKIFPLSHMVDCARRIMNDGTPLHEMLPQVAVLAGSSVLFLALGSLLFQWQKK